MSIMLSVILVGLSMSAESWSLTEEGEDEVCCCAVVEGFARCLSFLSAAFDSGDCQVQMNA